MNPKGVHNVSSRTWDSETYLKQAEDREVQLDKDKTASALRTSEYLDARKEVVKLDQDVGKVESVSIEKQGGRVGFYCKDCKLTFGDSDAYLNHINSSSHQAKIGQSMNVKRSSLANVKTALVSSMKAKYSDKKVTEQNSLSLDERVKALEEAEEKKKQARKETKAKRKREEAEEKQRVEAETEFNDDEAMLALGFGSFGSSKKRG